MHDISIEMLAPEQIRAAYPLLRQAVPGLTLGAWLRMAPRVANPKRRGETGIVIARRQGRPFPCGLFCYRMSRDLEHGAVLVADCFVGLDIVGPEDVLQALIAELDALARRLRCKAVHSVVRNGWPELARGLSAAGHRPESATFCKLVHELPVAW